MIRVLLVDDQPLIRAGLRILAAQEPDLEVVGEAGDGEAAVRLAHAERPAVVVMDIRMPTMDGIEATSRITATGDGTKVLILTTFDDDDNVYGALRAGASGFLVKDTGLDDIFAAVRVVAAGEALIAPRVTRRLIADVLRQAARPAGRALRLVTERITEREREVLTLVGQGLSNREIAERLIISPATAKVHVARLFTKLDARDRVQLVIIAYEAGLV